MEITSETGFHAAKQTDIKADLAIEIAALGTYEINLLTNEMHTSKRFNEIWGIEPGRTWTEIVDRIHPEDKPIRTAAHKNAENTGNIHYEVRVIWPDSSDHWVKINGRILYGNDYKPVTIIGVVHDINEQKLLTHWLEQLLSKSNQELQREKVALQENEERYQQMIAEIEDYAILLLDENGIIQNWNKGAEKIKGYKEEEIIGKSFKQFYTPEDLEQGIPEKFLARAVRDGKAIQEGWRIRKDGTTFWASVILTALHDRENKITGFAKITRDLTERKVAEDKIHLYTDELEFQNRELQQFAFVASHDMKEPLRKILFYTNLLANGTISRLTEKEIQALDKTRDAASRMQLLIDDILSYSQAGYSESNRDVVDLNTTVGDIVANLQDAISEINGRIDKTPALPTITGIPHQLSQLFDNLFSNAVKYRHPERPLHITLTYAQVIAPKIVGTIYDGKYHKIGFFDNGIGIASEDTERIFDLFQRLKSGRKAEGTGIGLAICKKIVQNHHGFIEAMPNAESGTTFNVYFPVNS